MADKKMADQDKLHKRLEAILKLPDNILCADCKKRGPRWASANLGVFMCIECSGIHRNLGVHISFVRSVNLDSWKKEQVDFMEQWGNARANAYYEANIPPHVYRPKEGDKVRDVEKYIRDKYEFKRYIASSVPPKSVSNDSAVDEDVDVRRRPNSDNNNNRLQNQGSNNTANKVAAPEVSLIDFMDFTPVDEPEETVQQQQQQQQSPSIQFGDFNSGYNQNQSFDQFNSTLFNGMPQQAPPPVPSKPVASADAILSLYNAQPSFNSMGGMPPRGPGYPPQQMNMGMMQSMSFQQQPSPQQQMGMMGQQPNPQMQMGMMGQQMMQPVNQFQLQQMPQNPQQQLGVMGQQPYPQMQMGMMGQQMMQPVNQFQQQQMPQNPQQQMGVMGQQPNPQVQMYRQQMMQPVNQFQQQQMPQNPQQQMGVMGQQPYPQMQMYCQQNQQHQQPQQQNNAFKGLGSSM